MPIPWLHNGEMSMIEGGDFGDTEPFRRRNNRGVHRAQRKVAVPCDQFCDAKPVGGCDRLRNEVARGQVAKKSHLWAYPQARTEEVNDLGNDQHRNDERARVSFEEVKTGPVMTIVPVDVGVERTSIDH